MEVPFISEFDGMLSRNVALGLRGKWLWNVKINYRKFTNKIISISSADLYNGIILDYFLCIVHTTLAHKNISSHVRIWCSIHPIHSQLDDCFSFPNIYLDYTEILPNAEWCNCIPTAIHSLQSMLTGVVLFAFEIEFVQGMMDWMFLVLPGKRTREMHIF